MPSPARNGSASDTRRLVFLSLYIALGGTLHVVEGMLPIPLPLPGVKLGLANIVTLLVLSRCGVRDGLYVAGGRVLLGSLLGGTFLSPAFFLALSGSCASALIMALMLRLKRWFSLIGVSLAGAVTHNLGQLGGAAILLQSSAVIYYLPILLLAAVPTGLATGYLLRALLARCDRAGIVCDYRRPFPLH